MDPQDQFKQRYNNFIAQRQQQVTGVNNPQSKTRSPFNKFYALGIIVGIVIILPAVFLFLKQNSYNGSSGISSTNASISSSELTSELKQIVGSADAKTDPQIVKTAERNILMRRAAQKLGVLPASIASESKTNYALTQFSNQQALEKKVISSRTIDFVNVYITPVGNYSSVQTDVSDNLTFIRNELIAGKSIKTAYASLVAKLGSDPKYRVEENFYLTKASGWNPVYVSALFAAKKGDITQVIDAKGTNYMVAKIKNAVDSKYSSFATWEKANLK